MDLGIRGRVALVTGASSGIGEAVLTARTQQLYGSEEAAERSARAEVPAQRQATPAEFAATVAYLCGAPASYVTGQTIAIDGGLIRGAFG